MLLSSSAESLSNCHIIEKETFTAVQSQAAAGAPGAGAQSRNAGPRGAAWPADDHTHPLAALAHAGRGKYMLHEILFFFTGQLENNPIGHPPENFKIFTKL